MNYLSKSICNNIAIYIHWPFCKAKCPYCDFNSHLLIDIDQQQWLDAYLSEFNSFDHQLSNKSISSIFFGGGTPSLMKPNLIETIINHLNNNYRFNDNIEITMEANPTSIEAAKLAAFKLAGINRISLGIQALNQTDLEFLGRNHSYLETIQTLELTSKIFNNFSFDLIYARPQQSIKAWQRELELALSFLPKHLSLYQLTIEKGTPFYSQFKNNKFNLPNEDLASELYELTEQIVNKFRLNAYEISNYALPGFESIHNLTYWRYQNFLGIGPGAHSRINNQAMTMIYDPKKWLNAVNDNKTTIWQQQILSFEQQLSEKIIMGLRLTEGINQDDFFSYFKKPLIELVNLDKLNYLQELKLINLDKESLKVSKTGKLVLNSIINQLIY